jgi:DNA repair photolyase
MIKAIKGRFFIDITTGGCRCGCLYCYVKRHTQVLSPMEDIESILKKLVKRADFIPGPRGTLLTFGSHCDLLENGEVASSLLFTLGKVSTLGNPIQFSTKCSENQDFAYQLSKIRISEKQIVVFISCPTIQQACLYEPGATSPANRFSFLDMLSKYRIPTCLYIKPFIPNVTNKEINYFVTVAKKYKPDAICIGDLYINRRILKRMHLESSSVNMSSGLKHPLAEDMIGTIAPPVEFIDDMKNKLPNMPIFRNSVCALAYIQGIPCPTQIWKRFPQLCVGCRDCQSM